jgi:hypothetical protein
LRRRFIYILSSLILLSLTGLGEDISASCPNVKDYKETEWVHTTNTIEKDSKCFYYNQSSDVTAADLNINLWSHACILYYNQRVAVQIISQTNLFCEIRPLNLLITQSYIPRKSIEYHPVS